MISEGPKSALGIGGLGMVNKNLRPD